MQEKCHWYAGLFFLNKINDLRKMSLVCRKCHWLIIQLRCFDCTLCILFELIEFVLAAKEGRKVHEANNQTK